MALRNPYERLDPPPRPHWKSQLTPSQFGAIAEDLLAVSLNAAASGSGTTARPLIDRGIDLYFRRLRSLVVALIQVKSLRTLNASGVGRFGLPVSEIPKDALGYLAVVHLPPPYDQLYRRIFLIPFADLHARCPRTTAKGIESFDITADFANLTQNPWGQSTVDLDDLSRWVGAIPGWSGAVTPGPNRALARGDREVPGAAQLQAGMSELWLAGQLERAGGMKLVIAEDRVRLDTVTLLLHETESNRIAGLHLRTHQISKQGTVHFEILPQQFFVDERLYVLVVILKEEATPADFCLLIPSAELAKLGFNETITIDPFTKKFLPYRIVTAQLATSVLKAVFGR